VRGTSPVDAIVPEVQSVVEDRGPKG